MFLNRTSTPDWSNIIVFSDEATFHLNGNVNLHNCFYYASENPHQILEKGMKSQSVTIWAMISYRHGIIYHVFDGTVNGENYAHLLETVVSPSSEENAIAFINRMVRQLTGA